MNSELPGAFRAFKYVHMVGGLIFGLVGVLFIVGLWTVFAEAPLVFKLIGTLISIGFITVAITITGFFGVVVGAVTKAAATTPPADEPPSATSASYVAVSPHGDALCPYCNAWFNVHGRSPR